MVSQNEVAKAQQLGYNDAISKVKMKDNNVLTANGHSSPTLEVSADLEKALVSLGVNDAASFGDEALPPGTSDEVIHQRKISGWERLKKATALKLGGLMQLQQSANSMRKKEATTDAAKIQGRVALAS